MPLDHLAERQAIVAEAYSWLRTPYHSKGRVKGAGTDCVWLLALVFMSIGKVPKDFDPGNYSDEWYLHRSEEIYLGGVEKYAHRVEVGEIGDVALYQHGRCVSHGAIIVGDGLIIHASRPDRQVSLTEMRSLEDKFHSYWSCFP